MTLLLTADWHLDASPENEYRWEVFEHTRHAIKRHGVSHVFILGDLVDRKDRFSAGFVNRLLDELPTIAPVTVLRGNHDTVANPPHFFDFLTEQFVNAPISYITKPTVHRDVLLLPFTPTPADDWRDLRLGDYRAIMMHATVSGAKIDHGIVLQNPSFPALPIGVAVYSGDIHHPQKVGPVIYVGSPHHVRFGDDYETRMLLIDNQTYAIEKEIWLEPPSKLMVEITSLDDLDKISTKAGDRVRLRFGGTDDLSRVEAVVAAWAQRRGVTVAGTEVIVHTAQGHGVDTSQDPETILRQFAAHEKVPDDVLAIGLELLKEADA